MKLHRLPTVILAGAIVVHQAPILAATLTYKGERLWSEETGFTAVPGKQGWVAVTSIYHHYSLILPGVEPWEFETSKDIPLRGTSERFVVTLDIEAKGDQRSAKKKLSSILERVQAIADTEVRNTGYQEFGNQLALRYQTRLKAPPATLEPVNEWRYTYWTVISRGDSWYILHFTPPPVPPPDQDKIPKVVDLVFRAGFRADFEVK